MLPLIDLATPEKHEVKGTLWKGIFAHTASSRGYSAVDRGLAPINTVSERKNCHNRRAKRIDKRRI
jgi:hypothetical protein